MVCSATIGLFQFRALRVSPAPWATDVDVAALITTYGYWAVAVGCLLEGETVLLLAGFAAHRGYLQWPWVMAVAAAAGFAGDMGFFLLGRRFAPQMFARWPSIAARRGQVDAWLARHGAWVVVAVRFLYGFRIAGPVLIGASGMHWARFAAFNALGAVLWAALLTGIGWFFGEAAHRLLGQVQHYEGALAGALLLAALGYAAWRHWRKGRGG